VWNGDEHSEPFLNEANFFRNRVDGRRDMYTESLYVSESGPVAGCFDPRSTQHAAATNSPSLVR
jgi:hypothetical protein